MRPRRRGGLFRVSGILVALLVVGVVRADDAGAKKDAAPAGESSLRTHSVPAGQAVAIARAVQKAYQASEAIRVEPVGDTVIVYGPSEVHDAVTRQAEAARPKETAEPPRLPRTEFVGQDDPPRNGAAKKEQKPGDANKPISITAFGNRLIISSEDPDAIVMAQQMVRLLTQTPEGAGDFEVIRLRYADAEETARIIDEVFNGPRQQQNQRGGGGFGGGRGGFGGGRGGFAALLAQQQSAQQVKPQVRIVGDPNTNSLLVWGSPLDQITVQNLVKAIDSADTDSEAVVKTWRLPVKYATASEVALVLSDVYREFMNENTQSATVGGFVSSRGRGRTRNVDARGNPRRTSLSLGVDDRTNTLVMACPEGMFKDIKDLVEEMDDDAKKATRTIKVVPVSGIDPLMVQDAINAIQGRPTSGATQSSPFANNGQRGGQRGGFGGGPQMGGFGGGGFGRGGFGGGSFPGGGFGGGQRGGFGGGAQQGGFGRGGVGGGLPGGGFGGGQRGGRR